MWQIMLQKVARTEVAFGSVKCIATTHWTCRPQLPTVTDLAKLCNRTTNENRWEGTVGSAGDLGLKRKLLKKT
jgi:hypothetical protein